MAETTRREALGKLVRDTWVECAKGHPNPKSSWLIPWEKLDDDFQRATDMAIGEAVAAAERERIRPLVSKWRAAAERLASLNPAWSSHFYDSAYELEALLDPAPVQGEHREGEGDGR